MQSPSLRAHRIAIVGLTLTYAPLYVAVFLVTAAINLGGGGVRMSGILYAGYLAAGCGLAGAAVCLLMTKSHRWQRAVATWGVWLTLAVLTPRGALTLWDAAPSILWAPPVLMLAVGVLCWAALKD